MSRSKKLYRTLHDAGRALFALADVHGAERAECGVYPCASCRGWHLTSARRNARSRWTMRALELAGRTREADEQAQ